jgi:hypothetical protein
MDSRYEDERNLIRKVLNSGEWQHTWHVDISKPKNYRRIVEIAEGKRDQAIIALSEAHQLIELIRPRAERWEKECAAELEEEKQVNAQQTQPDIKTIG